MSKVKAIKLPEVFNENEVKRGVDFFNELPKAKRKAFRKAFVRARGEYMFQKILNNTMERKIFFAGFFHLWTYIPREMFYYLWRAGKDLNYLYETLAYELTFNFTDKDVRKLGFFKAQCEQALRELKEARNSQES